MYAPRPYSGFLYWSDNKDLWGPEGVALDNWGDLAWECYQRGQAKADRDFPYQEKLVDDPDYHKIAENEEARLLGSIYTTDMIDPFNPVSPQMAARILAIPRSEDLPAEIINQLTSIAEERT